MTHHTSSGLLLLIPTSEITSSSRYGRISSSQTCQATFTTGTSPLGRLDWQHASRLRTASQRGCPFLLEAGSYRMRLTPRVGCSSQRARPLAQPPSHSCFQVYAKDEDFTEKVTRTHCFNVPKRLYLIRQIYP